MADTVTTHYDLVMPQLEGSQDTWGEKLNQDLVDLDVLLYNRVVKDPVFKDAAAVNPQVMGLHLKLPAQGNFPAGGVGETTQTLQAAATMGWVEYRIASMLNKILPIGTIIMWAGTVAETAALNAAGWIICNGSGGSPDLSDRIILAAGGHHAPGEFQGVTAPNLGAHVHAGVGVFPTGVAGAPTVTGDFEGAAIYYPSNATLPYYTVCYIYKFANYGAG